MRSPKSDWMPSSTPSFVPLDATSVHSVRYTGEGPVVQEKPLQHRGSEQLGPRGWIRGETAAVEYSYLPLSPPPAPLPQSRKTLTKRRQADVRVRRALRDAWCDPSRARKDLLDAGANVPRGRVDHYRRQHFWTRRAVVYYYVHPSTRSVALMVLDSYW